MSDSKFTSLLQRLEAVTVRLEGMEKLAPAGSASAASADDAPPSAMLADYDALLAGEVAAYVELAGKLGAADVVAQAKLVQQAFVAQREMLALVAKCKKPAEMGSIVQPTAEMIAAVQAAVDRRSASFNHLQAMGESIPALGWVMVEKTPAPHVSDMWQCGEFNQQKIVMANKGKDETQVEFAKSIKAIYTALEAFVKAHHRTGLEWNPKGGAVGDAKAAAPPPVAPDAPLPPPPPPPPPPPAPRLRRRCPWRWRRRPSVRAARLPTPPTRAEPQRPQPRRSGARRAAGKRRRRRRGRRGRRGRRLRRTAPSRAMPRLEARCRRGCGSSRSKSCRRTLRTSSAASSRQIAAASPPPRPTTPPRCGTWQTTSRARRPSPATSGGCGTPSSRPTRPTSSPPPRTRRRASGTWPMESRCSTTPATTRP
mmetsp:Transcript_23072/g.77851  ORF Transcript_23072/g.77851 Transcript_23072/m.77851 type:complete len:425 (+) Transcript_23072:60-1334(+)